MLFLDIWTRYRCCIPLQTLRCNSFFYIYTAFWQYHCITDLWKRIFEKFKNNADNFHNAQRKYMYKISETKYFLQYNQ